MKEHGYAYVSGIPTEDARADVDKVKLRRFYNDKLPDSVEGVHPSLVFNMDEMGAERYADRKRINVFLPEDEAPEEGGVPVGISRSSRRCTLIACIALDGTRLTPAIVTKTKTVNSLLFESGYDPERVKLYSTKTSFITRDVFGQWLVDVYSTCRGDQRTTPAAAGNVRREGGSDPGLVQVSRLGEARPTSSNKKHHDGIFGGAHIAPHTTP